MIRKVKQIRDDLKVEAVAFEDNGWRRIDCIMWERHRFLIWYYQVAAYTLEMQVPIDWPGSLSDIVAEFTKQYFEVRKEELRKQLEFKKKIRGK